MRIYSLVVKDLETKDLKKKCMYCGGGGGGRIEKRNSATFAPKRVRL